MDHARVDSPPAQGACGALTTPSLRAGKPYFLAGTIVADSGRTLGGLVALPAGE
jgi:hypothetical protein